MNIQPEVFLLLAVFAAFLLVNGIIACLVFAVIKLAKKRKAAGFIIALCVQIALFAALLTN